MTRPSQRRARLVAYSVVALCLVASARPAAPAPAVEVYDVGAGRAEGLVETLKPLLGENSRVSVAEGKLVVVGSASDQRVVRELVERLTAAPTQYTITIVQGASRGEAESLLAGRAVDRQSTRSKRTGSQISTLRVTSGRPARVESGDIVNAVDAVWAGFFAGGAVLGERPVTRGFSVTATQQGEGVEVVVEPFVAREGRAHAEERQVQTAATTLVVKPGEWVEIGGGGALPDPRVRTQSSSARLEQSLVLLRVDVAGG